MDVVEKVIVEMLILLNNSEKSSFSCLKVSFAVLFDSRSSARAAACTVPLCLGAECWEIALFRHESAWGHSFSVKFQGRNGAYISYTW